MVPSSTISVATGGECVMCGGFSLGETVHLRNFEFIADYFGGLSLSPWRCDSGVGSTRNGTPSLRWAMIQDSVEEFLTASIREGGFSLPYPKRRDTGAPLTPVTTTSWTENALDSQAMTIVPLQTVAP
jgi:hypothetical protein